MVLHFVYSVETRARVNVGESVCFYLSLSVFAKGCVLCPCSELVWSLLFCVYALTEGKDSHRTCPAAAECPL